MERITQDKECDVEHKTLMLDSGQIHYFVSGKENENTIVFLHPAFSDHRVFNEQVEYFSKEYKVITIDLIGHGLSNAQTSKVKIDHSTDHINEILELEKSKKAHFVGVSMGSLMAQFFALNHPEKVQSLTALGGYDINKNNDEIEKSQRSVQIALITRALFSMKAFRRKVTELTCFTDKGKSKFYESTSHYERKSFLVMEGLQNVIKDRRIETTNYATLILVGEHDVELAIIKSQVWHESLPNSTYLEIKKAGHCANLDQSDTFNRLLQKFIHKESHSKENYIFQ